jgi:hypothetical protein
MVALSLFLSSLSHLFTRPIIFQILDLLTTKLPYPVSQLYYNDIIQGLESSVSPIIFKLEQPIGRLGYPLQAFSSVDLFGGCLLVRHFQFWRGRGWCVCVQV